MTPEEFQKALKMAEKIDAEARKVLSPLEDVMMAQAWPAGLRAVLWRSLSAMAAGRAQAAEAEHHG